MTENSRTKLWFRYVNTATGDIHETHQRWCWCRNRGGRPKEHLGIPCAVDQLIDSKQYRRRFRDMIQNGQLPYLLACADMTMAREREGIVFRPSHYFASMTGMKKWNRTKAEIIRRELHTYYELLDSGELSDDDTALRRFRAKVRWSEHPDVCSVWTGASDRNGYGRFKVNGREVVPHRWWYEHQHGSLPPDTDVDHECGNRACMDHLRALPKSVNRARSKNPGKAEIHRRKAITDLVKSPPGVIACRFDMCPNDAEGIVVRRENGSTVPICVEHKDKHFSDPARYEWIPKGSLRPTRIVRRPSPEGQAA